MQHRLFHLAGPERLSRFEFGKVLCSVRGHNERLIEGVFQQQVEDKSGIPRPPGKQKTGKKGMRQLKIFLSTHKKKQQIFP